MKERKIGFGKINEYGDEVSLLLKEYTIQKIEKTQKIIEQRYSNGAIIKFCNQNEEKYAVELEVELHRQQLNSFHEKDINKTQQLLKQYAGNYLKIPRGRATWWPPRNLTAHLRFRFLWIMFIITIFLVWMMYGYFFPKSYFSLKWLFIAVGVSMLLNIGAVKIFNSPRKKAFKKLMKAKTKMPDYCNKILNEMNSIYSRFSKEGIDAIPETEQKK